MVLGTFIIDQKPFLSLLSSLQTICSKRTTLEVTSYILFQIGHREIILKATDLETSLQVSYQAERDKIGDDPCSFLVNGKRLFDLVKELDGDIACKVIDNQLFLTTDSVNLSLNIRSSEDFPPFPEKIENLTHVEAAFFLEMVNKVAFLIPQNNITPALNGLLVEISDKSLTMTSTDGHCLVQVTTDKYKLSETKKWLLPRRAVFEIKKILEVTDDKTIFVGTCGNQLVFSGNSFNFFTRLLQDRFPEYEAILNRKGFVPARVDRQNLVKTLRRSVCLLSGQFLATTFTFSQKNLGISLVNKDIGQLVEQVSLEDFNAPACTMKFYAPYLLGGLQVFGEKLISFSLSTNTKPIIFESDTSEKQYKMLYLVMPVATTSNS